MVRVLWLKAASLPHVDGSIVFARWCQCAPHLTRASLGPPKSIPRTASWSVLSFLHSSRQTISIVHNGPPLSPSELPLDIGGSGDWTPVSYMLPWAHRTQIPNSTLIGSAVFAQLTAESVYTLKWAVPTPVKITLPHGGSRPLSNTWFPGPTWVYNSNGILASSVVFARLTTMTDRPCYSISNNRPHLRSTAMLRCGRIQYFCTARDITRCTSDGLTT